MFGLALLDVFTVNVPQRARGAGQAGSAAIVRRRRLRHGGGSGTGRGAVRGAGVRRGADLRGRTGSALLGFIYLFVFSLGLTALLVAVGLSSGLLAALPTGRDGGPSGSSARAACCSCSMAEYYFVRMGTVL